MAAGPAIGADWVAAHGQGQLPAEQREELRAQLLKDIQSRGGCQGDREAARAQSEVEQFLRNGRVSATNLKRLERRVFALAGEGSLSARGEGPRSVSEFSVSSSRLGPPQSARQPSRQSNQQLDELLKALAPGASGAFSEASSARGMTLPSVPEAVAQQLGRWSEVAKYAKAVEDKEKEQKRELTRSQQQRMRQDLEQQIAEKQIQKQRMQAEDKELFKHQEAELVRWRNRQDAEREEAKHKALQVSQEREVQMERTRRQREEDHARKREEDSRLVQKAVKDLESETKMQRDKKLQKMQQQRMHWKAAAEEGKAKEEKKKLQAEEEKKKAKEYHQMLEEQQARNKQSIVVRNVPELPAPPPAQRGRDQYYNEDVINSRLKDLNKQAEEAELQKRERLKEEREKNQDVLFQQIAEREQKRRQVKESRVDAKMAAQEATRDYLEAERSRIEKQRAKNTQYRMDLEQQIDAKRAGRLPRQSEDQMSKAERAINQRLLQEVVELRGEP